MKEDIYGFWFFNEVSNEGKYSLVYRPCGWTMVEAKSIEELQEFVECFVDTVGESDMPKTFQETEPYFRETADKWANL